MEKLERRSGRDGDHQHAELQDQVDALERALHLQERTLSSHVSQELERSGAEMQAQFPFEKLLSMWRLKVVELLANQERLDHEQRQKTAEWNGKIRTLEEHLQREAAHVQTWQERCAVAQSQKKLLKLQVSLSEENGPPEPCSTSSTALVFDMLFCYFDPCCAVGGS